MTVEELIKELQKYPAQTKVMVTWEGKTEVIDSENIYLSKDRILLIDADNNFYKKRFTAQE